MNVQKLINEYQDKLSDLDILLAGTKSLRKEAKSVGDWEEYNELKKDIRILNGKRQMVVQFIADLESL